jgi:hypothetical protein
VNGVPEPLQLACGGGQCRARTYFEGDRLVVGIAFEIAQGVLALVRLEIDCPLADFSNFQAEHVDGEADCAFNVACAEPDVGYPLQVDHVRPSV